MVCLVRASWFLCTLCSASRPEGSLDGDFCVAEDSDAIDGGDIWEGYKRGGSGAVNRNAFIKAPATTRIYSHASERDAGSLSSDHLDDVSDSGSQARDEDGMSECNTLPRELTPTQPEEKRPSSGPGADPEDRRLTERGPGIVQLEHKHELLVFAMKALLTDALAVHTLAVPDAVAGTLLHAAILAGEVRETHASPVHAPALVVAVVRTRGAAAARPRVALVAHARPVHTAAVVVALVGAGGGGAVGAFPSRVAEAAAGVRLVGAVAAAAGVHALRKRRVTSSSRPFTRYNSDLKLSDSSQSHVGACSLMLCLKTMPLSLFVVVSIGRPTGRNMYHHSSFLTCFVLRRQELQFTTGAPRDVDVVDVAEGDRLLCGGRVRVAGGRAER
ncbi:hypothetical protein EYF80_044456 [Liparis tanakae]|uniref:Secreted protein n=1 Tax=Liparis tanakae TaxID=230148 RepID=A0A4Z2FYD7_9TELE|nr:hypothetical protein EYF80_044456 [Liparis tanakae]